jgi:hypothetical protein
MAICFAGLGFASSFLGISMCKTPSLYFAEMFSAFTLSGKVKERLKLENPNSLLTNFPSFSS